MKHFVILCAIVLGGNTICAQQSYLDSLLTELDRQSDKDTQKVITLYRITSELYNQVPDSAIHYGKRAVALADQLSYKRGAAKALNNLGLSYFFIGAYEEATQCFFRSMRIREDSLNGEGLSRVYNNLGLVYDVTGEYDKAEIYYQKGLDLAVTEGDTADVASGYLNLGVIATERSDYEKGLAMFRIALDVAKKSRDSINMGDAYVNIGIVYADMSNSDTTVNMDDSASWYLKKSLEIRTKIGDIYALANTYNNMAKLSHKYGRYAEADSLFHKALAINLESGNTEGMNFVYDYMSKLYAETGQWDSAFKYQHLFMTTSDSLNMTSVAREIALQELRYETEKEKREENIRREAEARENFLFTTFLVVIILIVTGFSVFLYNRVRLIRQQKTEIEQKNREITDSITYARRLQEAILPPDKLIKDIFPSSFVYYKPRDIVAGDFYWIERISNGMIYFAVADCTGHGVPGAMVSVVCSNALNRALLEMKIVMPGEILTMVRKLVLETFEKSESEVYDGMDIALCAIDQQNNKLYYAGAYNALWIVRKEHDVVTEVKADKQPIGKFEIMNPFRTHEIVYRPGDWIYMFTDGYADQFGGESGKKFKYSRLKSLIAEMASKPANEQRQTLELAHVNWQGKYEQVDDICIAGVQL